MKIGQFQLSHQDPHKQDDKPPPLRWWQVLLSVLAAGFGVQSRQRQEADFARGRPWVYILAGLLGTGLFVLGVIALVTWAIHLAQGG